MTVKKIFNIEINGVNLSKRFALVEIDDEKKLEKDAELPSKKGEFIIAYDWELNEGDFVSALGTNLDSLYLVCNKSEGVNSYNGFSYYEREFVLEHNAEEIAKSFGIEHEYER